MSKTNQQPSGSPLASPLCSAFLVGFCTNAVAWRLDQGSVETVGFPVVIGVLSLLVLALQLVNFRQNRRERPTR
jgi:hypothetical protein